MRIDDAEGATGPALATILIVVLVMSSGCLFQPATQGGSACGGGKPVPYIELRTQATIALAPQDGSAYTTIARSAYRFDAANRTVGLHGPGDACAFLVGLGWFPGSQIRMAVLSNLTALEIGFPYGGLNVVPHVDEGGLDVSFSLSPSGYTTVQSAQRTPEARQGTGGIPPLLPNSTIVMMLGNEHCENCSIRVQAVNHGSVKASWVGG